MRPRFTAEQNVRSRAKARVDSGTAALERWWSRKYRLPAYHQLFLERSTTDLEQEMLEDLQLERDALREKLADFEGDAAELLKQLNALNDALGEKTSETEDDLIDKWEREVAEGKIPDLDEME